MFLYPHPLTSLLPPLFSFNATHPAPASFFPIVPIRWLFRHITAPVPPLSLHFSRRVLPFFGTQIPGLDVRVPLFIFSEELGPPWFPDLVFSPLTLSAHLGGMPSPPPPPTQVIHSESPFTLFVARTTTPTGFNLEFPTCNTVVQLFSFSQPSMPVSAPSQFLIFSPPPP